MALTSPADVRIAVAEDVAGRRVVGYGGLFSSGGSSAYAWLTRWSVGPAGAAPERMRDAGPDTSGTQETMTLVLPRDGSQRPAASVVVSSEDPLVELVGPPEYTPDGTVSAARVPVAPRAPGLYVVEPAGSPGRAYALSVSGTQPRYHPFTFTGADDPVTLSGPAPPSGAPVGAGAELVRQALTALGLPASGVTGTVTWLSSGDPDGPVGVSATIRTGAGVDVVAVGSGDTVDTGSGSRSSTRLDGLSTASGQAHDIAWRVTRSTRESDPSSDEGTGGRARSVTGQVAVLASDEVRVVRLVDAGGKEVARQPVRDGTALFADATWATRAEFLAGTGEVLATRTVGVTPGQGAPLDQPWWYRLGPGSTSTA